MALTFQNNLELFAPCGRSSYAARLDSAPKGTQFTKYSRQTSSLEQRLYIFRSKYMLWATKELPQWWLLAFWVIWICSWRLRDKRKNSTVVSIIWCLGLREVLTNTVIENVYVHTSNHQCSPRSTSSWMGTEGDGLYPTWQWRWVGTSTSSQFIAGTHSLTDNSLHWSSMISPSWWLWTVWVKLTLSALALYLYCVSLFFNYVVLGRPRCPCCKEEFILFFS